MSTQRRVLLPALVIGLLFLFNTEAQGLNNLIVNGDFSAGNTGFTSQYLYNGGGHGAYYIDSDAGKLNYWWFGGDHTTGSGLFMIVDGAYNDKLIVWSETINVIANSDYQFSYYYRKVDWPHNDYAKLRVTVNGSQIGSTTTVFNDSWSLFSASWNSGMDTAATIEIRDVLTQTGGNGGDDFGLDDISFTQHPPTQYYALILGVSDYPGSIQDLPYAREDAYVFALALQKYTNWDPANVHCYYDSLATKQQVYNSLSLFKSKMTDNDIFVFYFSGHGSQGRDIAPFDEITDGKDEFICTYGSTPTDFIRDDELGTWLKNLPTSNTLVLLNSCSSGGFIGSQYNADLTKCHGSVVITACAADEDTTWYPLHSSSVFSFVVSRAIDIFFDNNGNGQLAAEELWEYILKYYWVFTLCNQSPQFNDDYPHGSSGSGDLPICEP